MVFAFDSTLVNAQNKTRTRLKMSYEKLANDDKQITLTLIQGKGKSMSGVENAELVLSNEAGDEPIEITSVFTNENGEATLQIEAGYSFPIDEEGYSIVSATYIGNDSLRSAENSIKFMDLIVNLSFDEIDSIKTIIVSSFALDSTGTKVPIEDLKFDIGVERLYSTLNLEKVETDRRGLAVMEFPDDVPGDSTGALHIIVKLNENDDYGTVIREADINWGTIVEYNKEMTNRSLFGVNAPLWMIISVAVILTGAWLHFLLAIFKVYKLAKLGAKTV